MILTIGREYGSGGHDIGKALSGELGLTLYDKQTLKQEAQKTDLYEEMQFFYDEEPVNSLLFAIAENSCSEGIGRIPFSHILEIADREPCIIIGRCANFILRDHPELVSVFVHAGLPKRAEKIARDRGISEAKARKLVEAEDKKRETFYQHYTRRPWRGIGEYQLSVDSGLLGTGGAVKLILDYIRYRGLLPR